jgi:hypothetical protein
MEGGVKKNEVICDYEIHPAASVFPLMEGEQFDGLVHSIQQHGVQNPIVYSDGLILDGRNRLRAVMKLRAEGHHVDLPKRKWSADGMTATQWIEAQNLDRRHLSPDAYTAASAALSRILGKEAKERKAASKFTSEKASKAAKARHAVRTKTYEPHEREFKAENARSTVGHVAAKAGTSMHKARQAVKLDQAVAAGVVPESVQKDVIAGKTKLRDAVKKIPAKENHKTLTNKKKQRSSSKILDDLRLLLTELLACDTIARQKIVDELTTWLSRAKS